MSRVMNGQAVDVDFGKHEASSYFVCEFWVSVLARLGAAVRSVLIDHTCVRLLRASKYVSNEENRLPYPASVFHSDAG